MLRLIAGILFGYAFFAFATLLLFQLSGRDPHAAADPAFMVGTIGAGAIAAFVGAYIGSAIARRRERTAGVVIATIIALVALFSLLAQPRSQGNVWSQLSALVVMAPCAFLGALIRWRRVRAPIK